jgi:hypothetical protein
MAICDRGYFITGKDGRGVSYEWNSKDKTFFNIMKLSAYKVVQVSHANGTSHLGKIREKTLAGTVQVNSDVGIWSGRKEWPAKVLAINFSKSTIKVQWAADKTLGTVSIQTVNRVIK